MESNYLVEALKHIKQEKQDMSTYRKVREIVPIEQWVENPYYVGSDGLLLYPFWKKHMIEIFRDDREISINEVVIQGSIGCLKEDTLVRTSIGYRTLKEMYELGKIKVQEGVKAPLRSIKISTEGGDREVQFVKYNGFSDTYKITMEDGTDLEGTKEHKFRVFRNGKIEWVPLESIEVSDILIKSMNNISMTGQLEETDIMYTLGYMSGYGGIAVNNKGERVIPYIVYQKGSQEESILKSGFMKIFGYFRDTDCNRSNLWMLRVTERDVSRFLLEEGFGESSEEKDIPRFVRKMCDRDICNYLRGLFDSDRHVSRTEIELTLKSEKLIRNVGSYLNSIGIDTKIVNERTEKSN